MEFLFECLTRSHTSERSERVRCRVENEKRNSISTCKVLDSRLYPCRFRIPSQITFFNFPIKQRPN